MSYRVRLPTAMDHAEMRVQPPGWEFNLRGESSVSWLRVQSEGWEVSLVVESSIWGVRGQSDGWEFSLGGRSNTCTQRYALTEKSTVPTVQSLGHVHTIAKAAFTVKTHGRVLDFEHLLQDFRQNPLSSSQMFRLYGWVCGCSWAMSVTLTYRNYTTLPWWRYRWERVYS